MTKNSSGYRNSQAMPDRFLYARRSNMRLKVKCTRFNICVIKDHCPEIRYKRISNRT